MGAEFFSVEPRPACDLGKLSRAGLPAWLRQVHRWTSIVFTLTVAANFAALTRRPVTALITYSPLPPLLVLTLTGLYMFVKHARVQRHLALPPTRG